MVIGGYETLKEIEKNVKRKNKARFDPLEYIPQLCFCVVLSLFLYNYLSMKGDYLQYGDDKKSKTMRHTKKSFPVALLCVGYIDGQAQDCSNSSALAILSYCSLALSHWYGVTWK